MRRPGEGGRGRPPLPKRPSLSICPRLGARARGGEGRARRPCSRPGATSHWGTEAERAGSSCAASPDTVPPGAVPRENGKHVGRKRVGGFTRTGCTGTPVQLHGLHHEVNLATWSLPTWFFRGPECRGRSRRSERMLHRTRMLRRTRLRRTRRRRTRRRRLRAPKNPSPLPIRGCQKQLQVDSKECLQNSTVNPQTTQRSKAARLGAL